MPKYLNIIQKDAAISVADIADKVGLSSLPCWRRIKRMEELGIIKNRVTILDRTKLGLDFEVFVAVKLALPNRENMEKLEKQWLICQKLFNAPQSLGQLILCFAL